MRVIIKRLLGLIAIAAGVAIIVPAAAHATPTPGHATITVSWKTHLKPGVVVPQDANDVTWSQTIIADPAKCVCGDYVIQKDTYWYYGDYVAKVDALVKHGMLDLTGQWTDKGLGASQHFWQFIVLKPCVEQTPTPTPTPTTTAPTTPETSPTTTAPTTPDTTPTTPETSPTIISPSSGTTSATTTAALVVATSPSTGGPSLAFTGIPTGVQIGAGIALLGGGTGSLLFARRRRLRTH